MNVLTLATLTLFFSPIITLSYISYHNYKARKNVNEYL